MLKKFPAEYIYEPWKAPRSIQETAGCIVGKDYPCPIVEHEVVHKNNIQRMKAAYAKRSPEGKDGKPITKGNYVDLKKKYSYTKIYFLMKFFTKTDYWFLFSLSRCKTQSDIYSGYVWEEGKEIKSSKLFVPKCCSVYYGFFLYLFLTLIHVCLKYSTFL